MKNVVVRAEVSSRFDIDEVWNKWRMEFKDYHPMRKGDELSFRTSQSSARCSEMTAYYSKELVLRDELAWVSIDVLDLEVA